MFLFQTTLKRGHLAADVSNVDERFDILWLTILLFNFISLVHFLGNCATVQLCCCLSWPGPAQEIMLDNISLNHSNVQGWHVAYHFHIMSLLATCRRKR